MTFTVRSVDELGDVVSLIIRQIEEGYKIILLQGDLGSGKPTLTKVLCEKLGVSEPVSSPTFSLVNEYFSPVLGIIYHMDLYRLEKTDDLVQIGLEEYLDSGQPCLIEWPGIAEPYFVMPHIRVSIRMETDKIRIFNITTHDTVDA